MKETYYIFETKEHSESELNDLKGLLVNFDQTKNYLKADFIISYGGDGTLLDCFNKFPYKKIYPIRDYARCKIHNNMIIDPIYTYSEFDVLSIRDFKVLSEVVIRNMNLSQAMRCNLYINDNLYAENIIGDGLIICTSLGSTGYFKNVTNTFFTKGNIGIGFINNAQNMANLIIPIDSKIRIDITRGDCQWAADHNGNFPLYYDEKSIEICKAKFNAKLINYKNEFMCNECRKERHSALVNSIYNVI